ncbi:hypothetical protein Ahy_B04g071585 isoform D [Arachis hypogaea]|nr:hypothetical protein Ahy_B04g071585 isoform D [Arachis hypogaea]
MAKSTILKHRMVEQEDVKLMVGTGLDAYRLSISWSRLIPIESLQDALKQLYLIDAIDENGAITSIGQKMAELPLEPSLSRTLMEANDYGCIPKALTVAAMLSAETTLLPGWRFSLSLSLSHTYIISTTRCDKWLVLLGQQTQRNSSLQDVTRVEYLHVYIGAVLDSIR